jgi:hypothetical protein
MILQQTRGSNMMETPRNRGHVEIETPGCSLQSSLKEMNVYRSSLVSKARLNKYIYRDFLQQPFGDIRFKTFRIIEKLLNNRETIELFCSKYRVTSF